MIRKFNSKKTLYQIIELIMDLKSYREFSITDIRE
ncbi:unnamed protein product [Paramecium sonneborni]|uniref:Uncharacterized protein n=1 Tax=Paramecium sonneborni TaxID=65129 RepID=A0A8S1R8W8_9CILI|nr:unnamed protein product [Paramecium sonneborni]